uniref:Coat protein homolog n=1 Tax=Beet yellows virus TaxID=12161 RepID=Q96667_9CLOS|nr:coat protein homolog [Beet yellows virus]AAC25119.1 minor coat protein [Beet yellows virus]AAF14304.1 minor capsid protein [Beet yellows virus]QWT83566.1 minor coat protein [Beet yellows virus]QWT83629.1 minor coat protein [Beet yellows virus]
MLAPEGRGDLIHFTENTRDAMETFFNSYDLAEYSEVNPNKLNRKETDELLGVIRERFKSELVITDEDFVKHLAFALIRAANITTSTKVNYVGAYEYTIGGKKFLVKDAWVFPLIKECMKKFNKPNPVRTFCATFEDAYIVIARSLPKLFLNRTIGKRGIPSGYEFLGADFLTATSVCLNDHEKAIVLQASRAAIDRAVSSSVDGKIVSLFDLGRLS